MCGCTPLFLWNLNAVNCAMHARGLKILEKHINYALVFFLNKTNKVLGVLHSQSCCL